MLKENAKKWVAALRSGEYSQGQKYLHKDSKFCCLGVACQLAVHDGEKIHVKNEDGLVSYDDRIAWVPDTVMKWLGLACDLGDYKGGSLAQLNDHKGKSFAEIANVIESEPEGLFVKETE